MSGLDGLIGRPSAPPVCKVLAPDISVHWFESNEVGAPCLCGLSTRESSEENDPSRPAQRRGSDGSGG